MSPIRSVRMNQHGCYAILCFDSTCYDYHGDVTCNGNGIHQYSVYGGYSYAPLVSHVNDIPNGIPTPFFLPLDTTTLLHCVTERVHLHLRCHHVSTDTWRKVRYGIGDVQG